MTDSERLERIESMLEQLCKTLIPGRTAGTDVLDRAIREFSRGNKEPLRRYKQRNGKITKGEASC